MKTIAESLAMFVSIQTKFLEIIKRIESRALSPWYVIKGLQKLLEGDVEGLGCPYPIYLQINYKTPRCLSDLEEMMSSSGITLHAQSILMPKLKKLINEEFFDIDICSQLVSVNPPNEFSGGNRRHWDDWSKIKHWANKRRLRLLSLEEATLFFLQNQETQRFIVPINEICGYFHIVCIDPHDPNSDSEKNIRASLITDVDPEMKEGFESSSVFRRVFSEKNIRVSLITNVDPEMKEGFELPSGFRWIFVK